MPNLDDQRIKRIALSVFDEREPKLMAAATLAGHMAAEKHCSDAHSDYMNTAARIDAGQVYIIEGLRKQDTEIASIKGLLMDAVRKQGVSEGRGGIVKAIMALVGGSGLLWVWRALTGYFHSGGK